MKNNNKPNIIIYNEWCEIFEAISDEQAGQLIKAIFLLNKNKKVNLSSNLSLVFIPIRLAIARNTTKWKNIKNARKIAGKKGGLKRAENERLLPSKSSKIKQVQANQAIYSNIPINIPINNRDIHLSSKNSLTPCTEDELIKVRKDLEINIDYVKNKHGGIMDLIESGEFQERYPKNKTVYNTLRQWLRSDLQKGYVKKESKFKITPY